jgi:hypothetical protein
MTPDRSDERSLGDLFAELSRETGQLVRKEVELASTELTSKARTAAAGIVIGLAEIGVPPWLSAVLVALATMLVGYLLVNKGIGQVRRTGVAPTQTIETLKETAQWTTRQGA